MNFLLAHKLVWNAPNEGTPNPLTAPAPTTDTQIEAAGSLLDGDGNDSLSGGTGNDTLAADGPVTIDQLSLPEGFEALVLETRKKEDGTEEAVLATDEALRIINDPAMSKKDRAQALFELNTKILTNMVEEQTATWRAMNDDWISKSKELPEIGGAKLPETLAGIKKGLDTLGATPEFYEALRITGAGNHPEVIRVLYAATKHLKEGAPVSGEPPKGKLTLASALYPSMPQ